MLCKKCKKELQDDWLYCPWCGLNAKKDKAGRYHDSEKDKYVAVYGDIIGTFPAKTGERLEEQDPTLVVFCER